MFVLITMWKSSDRQVRAADVWRDERSFSRNGWVKVQEPTRDHLFPEMVKGWIRLSQSLVHGHQEKMHTDSLKHIKTIARSTLKSYRSLPIISNLQKPAFRGATRRGSSTKRNTRYVCMINNEIMISNDI